MNHTPRIRCPEAGCSKETRIAAVLDEFDRWIHTPELLELVRVFGGAPEGMDDGGILDSIGWLDEFVTVWDYRKKQAHATTKEGEAARWLLRPEKQADAQRDLIFRAAERLGLIGTEETVFPEADYVLPLGGARLSNLHRCQAARETVDGLKRPVQVVALTGLRPISETERHGFVDTYAPEAKTEFDAMSRGMCCAFAQQECYKDMVKMAEHPNQCAVIRRFEQSYRGSELSVVAAPSTAAERRANSADCFHYFFQQFAVPEGAKLINCTSPIYCTYQQVRALEFAIQYGVEFDTIGFRAQRSGIGGEFGEPVQYLQEIKGTVDAMRDFVRRFVTGESVRRR